MVEELEDYKEIKKLLGKYFTILDEKEPGKWHKLQPPGNILSGKITNLYGTVYSTYEGINCYLFYMVIDATDVINTKECREYLTKELQDKYNTTDITDVKIVDALMEIYIATTILIDTKSNLYLGTTCGDEYPNKFSPLKLLKSIKRGKPDRLWIYNKDLMLIPHDIKINNIILKNKSTLDIMPIYKKKEYIIDVEKLPKGNVNYKIKDDFKELQSLIGNELDELKKAGILVEKEFTPNIDTILGKIVKVKGFYFGTYYNIPLYYLTISIKLKEEIWKKISDTELYINFGINIGPYIDKYNNYWIGTSMVKNDVKFSTDTAAEKIYELSQTPILPLPAYHSIPCIWLKNTNYAYTPTPFIVKVKYKSTTKEIYGYCYVSKEVGGFTKTPPTIKIKKPPKSKTTTITTNTQNLLPILLPAGVILWMMMKKS